MDINHSEEEVRHWGSQKDARRLHEYLSEEHHIEQDPHLVSPVMEELESQPRKRKWLWILGLLTVLLLGAMLIVSAMFSPAEEDAVGVQFVIEQGTSVTEIVQQLEDEGIIDNYWSVMFLLKLDGKEGQVKSGTFTLSPAMTPREIVAILTDAAPPKEDVVVTIPEGLTAAEIALSLEEEGVYNDPAALMDAEINLAEYPFVDAGSCSAGGGTPCSVRFSALEGYLFPDTYRFDAESTPQDIADRFLKNFSAKFDAAFRAEADARGMSLREVVIIASLIEEEALHDTERALIAGVITSRLERGMLLQIDASVLYAQEQVARAIPGARFEAVDREITFTDLEIDSPYNTYTYGGLPPGPIANPGLPSLVAALRPEASEYLYYLHDPDGNIHFARTLEEHISNRNRYLE